MAPGEVPAVFPDKRPLSGHLILDNSIPCLLFSNWLSSKCDMVAKNHRVIDRYVLILWKLTAAFNKNASTRWWLICFWPNPILESFHSLFESSTQKRFVMLVVVLFPFTHQNKVLLNDRTHSQFWVRFYTLEVLAKIEFICCFFKRWRQELLENYFDHVWAAFYTPIKESNSFWLNQASKVSWLWFFMKIAHLSGTKIVFHKEVQYKCLAEI